MTLLTADDAAPADLAEGLLAAHASDPAAVADGVVLVDYAEGVRPSGWSMRSALVRLAQRDPLRVAAVLEVVRRTDAVIKPYVRLLERTAVPTAPSLVHHLPERAPILDGRATDLARAATRYRDAGPTIAAYASAAAMDAEEIALIDLLVAAVHLDRLADALAAWAPAATEAPPIALLDAVARGVAAHLDDLGVARERDEPWRGRRGR